jgi:hypothetical protein
MTNAYQGPPPTRLVALSSLGSLSIGEKVRFLGWYGFLIPFSVALLSVMTFIKKGDS